MSEFGPTITLLLKLSLFVNSKDLQKFLTGEKREGAAGQGGVHAFST